MRRYESLTTLRERERERERELYSNKIMKIEARIAFISDRKKQAAYI